ncbi:tryptophan 7-halogenase [Colwellia sp. 1_MG-2023]|uniref:tryptophan halogenase family protein n=1 Tax=Colwellia sp. 1_MG-2023 TaxID=3062649 RepID=UPI0026E25132|nr:tryptophan halogenase family protein [Colwellia sp. 1_MG-2023]MDO6445993.1 tryptophan 7-halogenase [Colwellia sp. 1_MG-2023]
MQNPIKSICIIGGGSAGWMAAALLSSITRGNSIKITVIESPDINTIGVGESTVPSIIDFTKAAQIDLKDFIQSTSATFKLGIRFDNWLSSGENFFHPFGKTGKDVNGFDFYQAWQKSLADGEKTRWLDHSPNAIMAEHQRFMLHSNQQQHWIFSSFAHALHLDAVKAGQYLRELCVKRGVIRIEATVQNVNVDKDGFIENVSLADNTPVSSDFYIDCTGFKGLLIEKSLNVAFQDWSDYLPCNRAVTVQTEQVDLPPPYTVASAQKAGWSWHIPLQHRTGNGYVYCDKFCSDEAAITLLKANVKGKLLNEPNIIPFKTGRREKIWHKNCLALGLASGFLEPLESTAIHLVYKTLVHFIKHFPDKDFDELNETAFNEKINADYQEIRDFIILHYCTSDRTDSDFWRWCQTMTIPPSLDEKIKAFRHRGSIEEEQGKLFTSDSWYSILNGMHIHSKKYHPLLDGFHTQDLANTLNKNVQEIRDMVMKMPSHHDFIQTNCPAHSFGQNEPQD